MILLENVSFSFKDGEILHDVNLEVKNGQFVKEGQLIAKVGATGVATGNHLHFEVRKNGKTQNPINYIKLKN